MAESPGFKPNDPRLIGNKFAIGNKGGRPRTNSPPPEELEALGIEMVEWVRENKPTHLSEWYSLQKMIVWKIWNSMIECKEFCPYYEQALNMVELNARNGTLHHSIAQRFLSLYHRDLRKFEREEAKFQQEIKNASTIVDASTVEAVGMLMNQLETIQLARKMESKTLTIESKS